MQIHDFKDHLCNTIVIDRLATWQEFCRFKPNRVEPVVTCTGCRVMVHKSNRRNKAHYWLHHCLKCGRRGIVRADTWLLWGKQDHKCPCQRRDKRGLYGTEKTCKYCGRIKPASELFFYKSRLGYLSSNCKVCSKILRDGRRDASPKAGLFDFGLQYDRDLAGGNLIVEE